MRNGLLQTLSYMPYLKSPGPKLMIICGCVVLSLLLATFSRRPLKPICQPAARKEVTKGCGVPKLKSMRVLSTNQKGVGSIPTTYSPPAEVSLGKTFNP